jgi:hypothetical protein
VTVEVCSWANKNKSICFVEHGGYERVWVTLHHIIHSVLTDLGWCLQHLIGQRSKFTELFLTFFVNESQYMTGSSCG